MKKLAVVAILLSMVLATGCAVPISERNTTIVTAKKVVKGEAASELTDHFTFEGQIFAFLTFRWDDVQKYGGPQKIEVRWFNGEREISRRNHEANFGRPPHYVWFWTTGTAMGTGRCRVDAYANGKYVGTKSFTVAEK